jgi:DNA polymerase-4
VLEQSAARVAERLRSTGVAGRTITLHLRFADLTTATRSRTLPAAVDDATVIGATAAALVDTGRALTRIGVSVSNLEQADSLRLWTS